MKKNITKENQEWNKLFQVTALYFTYTRGVDYKGLNKIITPVIYHMTQNIGRNHRQTSSKNHAYMISAT